MAPASFGLASNGKSLQATINNLDSSSHLPFLERIDEIQCIIQGTHFTTNRNGEGAHTSRSIEAPLAILKWSFRWLLKQLPELVLNRANSEAQASFWNLFDGIITTLPENAIANSLKSVELLQSMNKLLAVQTGPVRNDRSSHQRQSSSETLVGTDAAPLSSPTIANPLKRKRVFDRNFGEGSNKQLDGSSNHGDIEKLAPGFIAITQCLQKLVNKIEGSPTTLKAYGQENLLDSLSAHHHTVAPLLANALRNVRTMISDPIAGNNTTWVAQEVEKRLKPFLFLWSCNTNSEEELQVERSRIFCTICLPETLALLSKIRPTINVGIVEELENLVLQLAINPAKQIFFSAHPPNATLEDSSFLDERFDAIFKWQPLAMVDDGLANGLCTATQLPEAILFDLASGKDARKPSPRSPAEEKWLSAVFQYLCNVWTDRTRKLETRDQWTEAKAQEQLLYISTQKEIRLDNTLLEKLIMITLLRYEGQPLSVGAWRIIGHCIAQDPEIALNRAAASNIHNSEKTSGGLSALTKILFLQAAEITSCEIPNRFERQHAVKQPQFSVSDIPSTVVVHFIMPLFNSYIRTRRFDQFVLCWCKELMKARVALKEPDAAERVHPVESVWEDADLLAAVAAAVPEFSHQVPSLLQTIAKEMQSLSPKSVENNARIYSSSLVLSTIIGGINVEPLLSDLENQARDLKDRIEMLTCSTDDITSHDHLLWAIQSRLSERWPQVYFPLRGSISSQRVVELAEHTIVQAMDVKTNSLNTQFAAFAASSFSWRLCHSLASHVPREKWDKTFSISKIVKLACLTLKSSHEMVTSYAEESLNKFLAEEYVILILDRPNPLEAVKPVLRRKTFRAIWKLASNGHLLEDSESLSMNGQSRRSNVDILQTVLRGWLAFGPLQDHQTIRGDTCATLLEILDDIITCLHGKKIVDIGDISLLLEVLANRPSSDWTKQQQETIVKMLMELLGSVQIYGDKELNHVAMLVLNRVLRKRNGAHGLPLRTRESLRDHLVSLYERRDDRGEGILSNTFEGVQQLLGFGTETPLDPIGSLGPKIKADSTRDDVRRIFARFKEHFAEGDANERGKIIRQHLLTFRKEKTLENLIFTRKLCAIHIDQPNRTEDVKGAYQELISELFSMISASCSMKHVSLAQRAIAVAFKKNSWVVGQMHVDLVFACATSLPLRKGDREVDESPALEPTEPEKELPKTRSRLDIASAQRLVFGSLGMRAPKTKADEERLRQKFDGRRVFDPMQTNDIADGSNLDSKEERTSKGEPNPLDARLPPTLYAALCDAISATLLHHRTRIGGRWHLVVSALRSLLSCLFEPYHSSPSPPWMSGAALDSMHATSFARLLTLLCEPSASAAASVSASKKNLVGAGNTPQLHDDVKRVKEIAGQHLPPLLKAYCALSLRGELAQDKKAALQPGLFALLDAVGREGTEVLNESLSKLEREIFRALWDSYVKFGKWQGK